MAVSKNWYSVKMSLCVVVVRLITILEDAAAISHLLREAFVVD